MEESEIVIRPLKITAEFFTGIAGVFLIVASVGHEWVEVKFFDTDLVFTWGLWESCVGGLCIPEYVWMEACQAFCLMAVLLTIGAFVCGFIGLCINSNCSKYTWFIIAGGLMVVVALCDLLALIIYPIMFGESIKKLDIHDHWQFYVRRWDFDWSFGFGVGGLVFTTASAIFFFIPTEDKQSVAKPF